jgi:xanthosine utilization system XapX-like protein
MVSECPTCAYHFEREEGFFLGAMVVNIAITEALIIGVIAIGFGVTLPNPPLVKLAVIAGLGGFLMPFLAYPFTKTTWSAVDMIMRGSMGESYGRTGGRQPGTRLKRPDQVKRSDEPEQRE